MLGNPGAEQLVILNCSVNPSKSDAANTVIGCNYDGLPRPAPPRPMIVPQPSQQPANTPDSQPANYTLAFQTGLTDIARVGIQTDTLIFVALICIVLLMMNVLLDAVKLEI